MGEHLDFDQLALRAADVVLDDLAVDGGHLFERELAGQHHRVGPLGEEADRLGVRDVALGRDVDLDPHAPCVEDCGEVGGDDGVDPLGAGAVDDGVHVGHLILVDHRVDRQVGLHAVLVGRFDDAPQVVEREVGCRGGAHVEFSHAEVDRIGPGVDGGHQRLVGADRGHDFYFGTFHRVAVVVFGSGSFRFGTPRRGLLLFGACLRAIPGTFPALSGPLRLGSLGPLPGSSSAGLSGRVCSNLSPVLSALPSSAGYFLRPIRLSANSRMRCVREASTERVSSSASARSNLSEICCSVSRGTSSRS